MKKAIIIILALLIGISIGNYQNISASAEGRNLYVGRVLIDLTTGKIIEYQGVAYYRDGNLVPLGTLTQNGINAGLNPTNLQEKYVNQTEYQSYANASMPPKQIAAKYQQAMTDLNLIINTTNPTTAQMIWAIKRMAEIEKAELQYHKIETELI